MRDLGRADGDWGGRIAAAMRGLCRHHAHEGVMRARKGGRDLVMHLRINRRHHLRMHPEDHPRRSGVIVVASSSHIRRRARAGIHLYCRVG